MTRKQKEHNMWVENCKRVKGKTALHHIDGEWREVKLGTPKKVKLPTWRKAFQKVNESRKVSSTRVSCGLFASRSSSPFETVAGKHKRAKRGECTGFSDAAARRLRDKLDSIWVPGFATVNMTFTIRENLNGHDAADAAKWRRIVDNFSKRVCRAGYAAIWRVELQRRKTPHLHTVFFLPDAACSQHVREMWLDIVGRDPSQEKYAVHTGSSSSARWLFYMAMHHSKAGYQSEWHGRQWGIFNSARFEEYPKTEIPIDLTSMDRVKWARVMHGWLRSNCRANGYKCRWRPLWDHGLVFMGIDAFYTCRLISFITGKDLQPVTLTR